MKTFGITTFCFSWLIYATDKCNMIWPHVVVVVVVVVDVVDIKYEGSDRGGTGSVRYTKEKLLT